jgi:hypothetical protein
MILSIIIRSSGCVLPGLDEAFMDNPSESIHHHPAGFCSSMPDQPGTQQHALSAGHNVLVSASVLMILRVQWWCDA